MSSSLEEASSSSSVHSIDTVAEELKRPDVVGALSARGSINFGIPTQEGAKAHVRDEYGHESWRYNVLHFIHDTKVQVFLMSLLLLDVLVLFVEIFLTATYPPCHIIERDAISCCPVSNKTTSSAEEHYFFQRVLASAQGEDGAHGHHDAPVCEDETLEPFFDYTAGCDGHKWSAVHRAEDFLFGITIAILSVFMLELIVSMFALKPQVFFRQFFYLMDFVVVSVSLTLELTFHFMDEESLQSLIGLLVAARIWRFIRIGHGIVEVSHIVAEKSFDVVLDYTEQLEEILRDHDIDVPENEKIRLIRSQVHSHSSAPGEISLKENE